MKHCGYFLACITLLAVSAGATSLSQRDLATVGDGLITFDSNTDLEWLDVNVTSGMTFLDAQAYGAPLGFAHASLAQVKTLLVNAGVSSFFVDAASRDALLANVDVQNALEYLRLTSGLNNFIPPGFLGNEFFNQTAQTGENAVADPAFPGYHFQGSIRFEIDHALNTDPWQFVAIVSERLPHIPIIFETDAYSGGHYLVRAVPEAMSTAWLALPVACLLLRSGLRRVLQRTRHGVHPPQ